MKITLDHHNDEPLYEQIASQIRRSILFGELVAESPLLPVRELAKELKSSVTTVKRAYDTLKAEGYIYGVPGKGFFVNNKNTLKDKGCNEIRRRAAELAKTVKQYGFTQTDVAEIIDALWTSTPNTSRG